MMRMMRMMHHWLWWILLRMLFFVLGLLLCIVVFGTFLTGFHGLAVSYGMAYLFNGRFAVDLGPIVLGGLLLRRGALLEEPTSPFLHLRQNVRDNHGLFNAQLGILVRVQIPTHNLPKPTVPHVIPTSRTTTQQDITLRRHLYILCSSRRCSSSSCRGSSRCCCCCCCCFLVGLVVVVVVIVRIHGSCCWV